MDGVWPRAGIGLIVVDGHNRSRLIVTRVRIGGGVSQEWGGGFKLIHSGRLY